MKKFNIESIDVLGRNWKIIQTDDHPYLEVNTGYIDHPTDTIYIEKSRTFDHKMSTLLHEIFHVISYQLGLNIDEGQTQCLETALYQVLHVNKLTF